MELFAPLLRLRCERQLDARGASLPSSQHEFRQA